MTYENIVKSAEKAVKELEYKNVQEHIAVEVDVEGEGEGAFYIEFSEGTVKVEPYNYYDRDVLVRGNADAILNVLNGRQSLADVKDEVIWEGNLSKAAMLKDILNSRKTEPEKKAVKKASSKKKTVKSATPKKK
ncbi:MAG: SCP2 sterol-binding domain-containing protein [Butyrivibrio sp.]|jgi:hypothetical protein|nr:SCP2 sterol-binding domain-containing protein [Butyrivibrio sp.]